MMQAGAPRSTDERTIDMLLGSPFGRLAEAGCGSLVEIGVDDDRYAATELVVVGAIVPSLFDESAPFSGDVRELVTCREYALTVFRLARPLH